MGDVRELLRLCEIGLRPHMTPYRWLVDLRGLELVEPATFALFLEHTRKNGDALGRNVVKQAQLRPDGIVGAVIAGFSRVARLSYPDRVFGEVDEALDWLELERAEGLALLAELEAIRRESREGHEVVARLQRELDWRGGLAIEDAASRLGMSTRSLQRALREAGTTYRGELDAFRIRRAQDLLRRDERTLMFGSRKRSGFRRRSTSRPRSGARSARRRARGERGTGRDRLGMGARSDGSSERRPWRLERLQPSVG